MEYLKLYYKWSGQTADEMFNVEYEKKFDLRDEHADLALLAQALQIGIPSPTLTQELHKQITKIVVDNGDKLDDIFAEIDGEAEPAHAETTPETRTPHIQQMIMDGLTDQQMLDLHPEITQADIDAAKQNLLETNDVSQ